MTFEGIKLKIFWCGQVLNIYIENSLGDVWLRILLRLGLGNLDSLEKKMDLYDICLGRKKEY